MTADWTYRLSVVTSPSDCPVDIGEVKAFMLPPVDYDEDDALIAVMIEGLRRHVEADTGRAIGTQTLRVVYDMPNSGRRLSAGYYWQGAWEAAYFNSVQGEPVLELPKGPVQSITSVVTTAIDGTETTMSTGGYYLDGDRLVFTSPLPSRRQYGGLTVNYVSGYTSASDEWEAIRMGMLLVLRQLYECRGDYAVGGGEVIDLPHGSRSFFDVIRKVEVC